MKSNDYVKFLTQTFVEHINTPKEERMKKKIEKKQMKEPLTYKYFGIMPFVVKEGVKMASAKHLSARKNKVKSSSIMKSQDKN